MTLEAKRKAITDFVIGVDALRDEVKADAIDMLAAVPLDILGDADALEEFLTEMLETVAYKHLISPDGKKVRPRAASLIRAYVRGMAPRE